MSRNVTDGPQAAEIPRSLDSTTAWDEISGRGDPEQRFRLYRLCPCETCYGSGKIGRDQERCPDCRGEGRVRELVATAGTPEAVGVALVQLGREGEWDDCPLGCLDTMGDIGEKWIVKPWEASPRNASDAGRVLQRRRRKNV